MKVIGSSPTNPTIKPPDKRRFSLCKVAKNKAIQRYVNVNLHLLKTHCPPFLPFQPHCQPHARKFLLLYASKITPLGQPHTPENHKRTHPSLYLPSPHAPHGCGRTHGLAFFRLHVLRSSPLYSCPRRYDTIRSDRYVLRTRASFREHQSFS